MEVTTEMVVALCKVLEENSTVTMEELAEAGCDYEALLAAGYIVYVGSGLFEEAPLTEEDYAVEEDGDSNLDLLRLDDVEDE